MIHCHRDHVESLFSFSFFIVDEVSCESEASVASVASASVNNCDKGTGRGKDNLV